MLSPTGDAEEEYLPLRTTPTSARRALTPTGTGGVSAARPCRGGSERAHGPLALSQGCTNLSLCEKERGENGEPPRARRRRAAGARAARNGVVRRIRRARRLGEAVRSQMPG